LGLLDDLITSFVAGFSPTTGRTEDT